MRLFYRMNEPIMKWSSDTFYEAKLVAAESVKSRLLADLPGVASNENTQVPLVQNLWKNEFRRVSHLLTNLDCGSHSGQNHSTLQPISTQIFLGEETNGSKNENLALFFSLFSLFIIAFINQVKMFFLKSLLTKYQSMTCNVRLQLVEVGCGVASCYVRAEPSLVGTCNVRACAVGLQNRTLFWQ